MMVAVYTVSLQLQLAVYIKVDQEELAECNVTRQSRQSQKPNELPGSKLPQIVIVIPVMVAVYTVIRSLQLQLAVKVDQEELAESNVTRQSRQSKYPNELPGKKLLQIVVVIPHSPHRLVQRTIDASKKMILCFCSQQAQHLSLLLLQ
jgi:hypothetical protein